MTDEIYYDPYDFDIDVDPYPVWKRLRDEAPLYYNEKYDFFAVSRFDDVERCSVDWRTYLLGQGLRARDDQERRRDPARHHPVRGSADARRAPLAAVAGVHAAAHRRARAEGARVLRRAASTRWSAAAGFDFIARPRRADADAHHRHAARHPRGGPGGHPRPDRRGHAARRTARRPTRARRWSSPAATTSPTTSTGAPSTRPTTS